MGRERERDGQRKKREEEEKGKKKRLGRGAGKAEVMRNPPGGCGVHFSTYLHSPVVIVHVLKCHKYNSQAIYSEHNQNII